jgi:hypothetical protein
LAALNWSILNMGFSFPGNGEQTFAALHNNHSRPFSPEVKKYLLQRSIAPAGC